ncbi:hypothetical protein [Mycolicibacillus trivialis]|uniref:Uncharacterized protein n=1 Tax=Mycolicibacillus trivialis TaxID=1798 RepID=A0A1X2EP05_9MYCO|nr:hypothetical protein [Mycolicibacillus trivialis]ORX07543.1 hypothetical protein AWC30_04600 [Mycolicibacillus trivialis]
MPETSWSGSPLGMRLSASVQAFDPLDDLLSLAGSWGPQLLDPVELAVTAPPAAAGTIGAAIEGLYNTLEGWVRYGVELAEWAVGWVPLIGLAAGQIPIFYDLGESVVRSLLFTTIAWLDGSIGFGTGLADIGTDIAAAIGTFFQDQIDWLFSWLPPLPGPLGLDLAAAGLPQLLTSLGLSADALPALGGDLLGNLGGTLGDLLLNLIP